MLALLLPCWAYAQQGASYTNELVHTEEGNFYLTHRTPAKSADVRMPIFSGGTTEESFAYRVRDRKLRDLLFLARMRITYPRPAGDLKLFYLGALGETAAEETDAKTGVITLTAGEQDHFRLVEITPQEQGCAVKLERVQQFTIPPRVYTETEQRIVRVLNDVASRYRTAEVVSYIVEQTMILPKDTPKEEQPPTLLWSVAFTRPAQLAVTTSAGRDSVGMRITTKDGALRVHQPAAEEDEVREIVGGYLSINDVPELRNDPVARLMLGGTLLTDQLDYIGMSSVKDVPTNRQAEIILTYPDRQETLHLFIDLRQKTILRCETVVSHDGQTARTIRSYRTIKSDPIPEPTPPQPASPPATPAVVRP